MALWGEPISLYGVNINYVDIHMASRYYCIARILAGLVVHNQFTRVLSLNNYILADLLCEAANLLMFSVKVCLDSRVGIT